MRTEYTNYEAVLQHSDLYGKVIPEDGIVNRISKLNMELSLIIVSRLISMQIDIMQNNDEAKRYFNVLKYGYSRIVTQNGGNMELYFGSKHIYCLQTLFILSKWILVHGVELNDQETIRGITIDDVNEIISLAVMINDYLPLDVDVEGYEIEFLYTTIYHNTFKNIKNQIARSYYIFVNLMEKDDLSKKNIYDFQSRKGYTIKEYLAVLFNCLYFNNYDLTTGGIFGGSLGHVIEGFDAGRLQHCYSLIVKDLSMDYKDMKYEAIGTKTQQWNFELFYSYPWIKLNNIVLNFCPITSIYKFFDGLYWTIRYLYDKKEGLNFMRDFGRPFEKYVQLISASAVLNSEGAYTCQNEFSFTLSKKNHKSSDYYIKKRDKLLVIEVKAKSPHSNVLKGYEINLLYKEVIDLIVAPTHQVDCRLQEILNPVTKFQTEEEQDFFTGIKQIYVICVSMEKIQPINDLLCYADKFLIEGKSAPIEDNGSISNTDWKIKTPEICAYFNFNIEDYEALCNLIDQKIDVFSLLSEFFSIRKGHKYEVVPLSNFLIHKEHKYDCSEFVQNELEKVLEDIYHQTFGE
ncbi:hypothetical protein [Paenibacillus sp. CMAA1364]